MPSSRHFSIAPTLLGGLLTVALLLTAIQITPQSSHWLNRLDFLWYDWRLQTHLQWFPADVQNPNIVIVDIDEASLQQVGRWPWSRSTIAQLVQQLAAADVAIIGFDWVLSEPERHPLDDIQRRLQLLDTPLSDRYHDLHADGLLAQALPSSDVVMGFFLHEQANVQVGQLPPAVAWLAEDEADQHVMLHLPGYVANLPVLQAVASGAGFVSTMTDADGVVRRTPLVVRQERAVYPSLALAMAMNYVLETGVTLDSTQLGSVRALREVSFAGLRAQTDPLGRVIVPYRGGRKTFRYLSASDVLQQRVPVSELEGAMVLLGTSAIGLSDLRATPVGTQYPGVEVHATVLDALLGEGFPLRPDWEAGATSLQILLLGLMLSIWLPRLGPLHAITVGASVLMAAVLVNWLLWHLRWDLPLAPIVLLIAGIVVCNLALGFVRENRHRRHLRGMFGQYVPSAHIEKMLTNPEVVQLAGETKTMSVLFSDIRGFTALAEGMSAVDLTQLLNDFFTPITKVIFDHEGTIDKYVGDMVMAFWGAPLDDEQHAEHAVAAALAMLACTERLNGEFQVRGLPPIRIGIGINTGAMHVGDMGSSYRRAYTVLGDAVNLGSRLESLTSFYGVSVLVSESTRQAADAFAYRCIDRIQVKGKQEAVTVYEPVGLAHALSENEQQALQLHEQALAAYRQQQWSTAQSVWSALQQQEPDRRIYALYLERIVALQQQSLGPDWDGVYRHSSKSG